MAKLLSRVKANVEMAKLREDEEREKLPKPDMTGTLYNKQDMLIEFIIANPDKAWSSVALKAGYSGKGMDKTISRLRNDKNFKKRLQDRRDSLAKKLHISLDRVAEEYARIAFLDPSEYYSFDKEGKITGKSSEILDLKPVVSITGGTGGKGVTLTFHNKLDGLKALRDMFGYDKPSKHAHLLAGNGQGITDKSLESAIIGLITGTPQAATTEALEGTPK
jgi:phage terminase small subunit